MIVQVVKVMVIAKDSLIRYTVTPLMRRLCSRGGNLSWHSRSKRKRTEVISDNLSQPSYHIVNVDCLNRNAVRLLGNRPMKIRQGNSSPSRGKPCTRKQQNSLQWRRGAANNLNTIDGKCVRHEKKS